MTFEEYVACYAQRHPVYWGGGVPWRKYKAALLPLALPHVSPRLNPGEIRRLLKESKCALAMWTHEFDSGDSEWWWIIAQRPYTLDTLSKKTRYGIRHGLKHCRVRMLSGSAVAEIGYDCYRSAMLRHTQSKPLGEREFKSKMVGFVNEIEHVWGVFVEDKLAGFATYLARGRVVSMIDAMFDPAYFRLGSSYALIHTTTDHYLNREDNDYVSPGMRSISHETGFQDFLTTTFGYRRAYCRLEVAYTPTARLLSRLVYRTEALWKRAYLPRTLRNRVEVAHRLACIEDAMRRMEKEGPR
jgi:hypothetical protein